MTLETLTADRRRVAGLAFFALAVSIIALAFAVVSRETPCAGAQTGSCSVGDFEAFSDGISIDEGGSLTVAQTAVAARTGDQVAFIVPTVSGDIVAEFLPSVAIDKSADEVVTTSVVLQNDDDFVWTAPANATYQVEAWWNVTTSSTGGLAAQALVPSGTAECSTTGVYGAFQFTHSTPFTNGTANDGIQVIQCEFLVGVTGGTTGFQWAQGAAAGTTTLESNSFVTRFRTQ